MALLPFVEEKRLWEALGAVYDDLTEEEGKVPHHTVQIDVSNLYVL